MESRAKVSNLRSTPRKARLVADAVRGMKVGDALSLLELNINKKVAADITKLLKSAVANMQSAHTESVVDVDVLKIQEIRVDCGPVMKRFRARAQGRAAQILKRMCHISVKVAN